jgi:hypothetical protein
MNRSLYHGKRIALVMEVQGRRVVLRGTTSVRQANRYGQTLKVRITEGDDAACGSPTFWISERRWRGRIASGLAYGCDLMLNLSPSAVAAL